MKRSSWLKCATAVGPALGDVAEVAKGAASLGASADCSATNKRTKCQLCNPENHENSGEEWRKIEKDELNTPIKRDNLLANIRRWMLLHRLASWRFIHVAKIAHAVSLLSNLKSSTHEAHLLAFKIKWCGNVSNHKCLHSVIKEWEDKIKIWVALVDRLIYTLQERQNAMAGYRIYAK